MCDASLGYRSHLESLGSHKYQSQIDNNVNIEMKNSFRNSLKLYMYQAHYGVPK